MINITKCDDCIHKPICNFAEAYEEIINLFNDDKVKEVINGQISCKHYSENRQMKKDIISVYN